MFAAKLDIGRLDLCRAAFDLTDLVDDDGLARLDRCRAVMATRGFRNIGEGGASNAGGDKTSDVGADGSNIHVVAGERASNVGSGGPSVVRRDRAISAGGNRTGNVGRGKTRNGDGHGSWESLVGGLVIVGVAHVDRSGGTICVDYHHRGSVAVDRGVAVMCGTWVAVSLT